MFEKVKSDRMGSHPDWIDFLQSDDWANDGGASSKIRETSKDDNSSPAETYKMAEMPRRVPNKHIISLDEFDDIRNIVSKSSL